MSRLVDGRCAVGRKTYLLVSFGWWDGLCWLASVYVFCVVDVYFVADGGLLGADTNSLGADARFLGADANFLDADANFLGADGYFLVAGAKSPQADERLLNAEGNFLHADENSLRDDAYFLKSGGGFLLFGAFKLESAYLFVLGA
jgi:hypothetical protein